MILSRDGHKIKNEFQQLLSRYTRERLLYRLSLSEYRDRFILKGALLFSYWTGAPHRPTRDIALLEYGPLAWKVLQRCSMSYAT